MNRRALALKTHCYDRALTLKNPRYRAWVKQFTLYELKKDLGSGDYTTEAYFTKAQKNTAYVVAKENGILAGVQEIEFFLQQFHNLHFKFQKKDGNRVRRGDKVLLLTGDIRLLVKIERIILNLLGRMSGVATTTARMVKRARGKNHSILLTPTRKTLWGLLDKRACVLGGGGTHRLSLDDAILIKHNHLKAAGVPVKNYLKKTVTNARGRFIEIEVTSARDAFSSAEILPRGIIMFDNCAPLLIKKSIDQIKQAGFYNKVLFEASGGITEKSIKKYAQTGIDILSLGMLTHSASSLDFSMRITSQ